MSKQPPFNTRRPYLFVLFILLFGSSFQSCVSYKNQIFFQGLSDTTYNASMKQQDPIIQRGDQLMIMVYALDMESVQVFNQTMGGGRNGGGNMMTFRMLPIDSD